MDQIVAAHAAVGGVAPGRRYTTQHINQSYVMLLSGQFQGFCRDLHSEAVDVLLRPPVAGDLRRPLIQAGLTTRRKLDHGNPNPDNLRDDFALFGFSLWAALEARDAANADRRRALRQLNVWRNAIAHQEFSSPDLNGRTTVRLQDVRGWRAACEAIAVDLDAVLAVQLGTILGANPW